eukprot:tig00000269_g23782.t1
MGAGPSLQPYVVLVVGASSGIGRETALLLDRAGFKVFASVLNAEEGRALQARASSRLQTVVLDITKTDDIEKLPKIIRPALADWGRLGVVCNSGTLRRGPLETMQMADVRRIFEVNVVGHFGVLRALLPEVRRTRGRVVLVGSIASDFAMPFYSAYCASKRAVEGLAESLRRELAPHGVSVSLVKPGHVRTAMTDVAALDAESAEVLARSPDYDDPFRRSWSALRAASAPGAMPGPGLIASHVLDALSSAHPKRTSAPRPRPRPRRGCRGGAGRQVPGGQMSATCGCLGALPACVAEPLFALATGNVPARLAGRRHRALPRAGPALSAPPRAPPPPAVPPLAPFHKLPPWPWPSRPRGANVPV